MCRPDPFRLMGRILYAFSENDHAVRNSLTEVAWRFESSRDMRRGQVGHLALR
jgi:hypothetical protein